MRTLILVVTLLVFAALPAAAGWDEGVAAFTAKNYTQAAKEFQGVVDQNPEGYRGHYMLGLSLEQLGRKEDALNHLRKAYDLNPGDLNTKLALARSYKNLRRYSDVVNLLSSADPSSLPAAQSSAFYAMRGEARLRSGNEDGALADFEQLARLSPGDAQTQFLYGTTALSAGQTDAAVAALAKAAQLDGKDPEKKRAYVNALIKQGRVTSDKAAKRQAYQKAAAAAKELSTSSPTYDNLLLQTSAELGAGLYGEAIASGKAAIAKKSDDWLAHYYLGQAYSSNKQFAEAEKPLQDARAIAKGNDLKNVWKQLGFVYERQKKFTDSIEAYKNAGDNTAVARVTENEKTESFNRSVEEENSRLKALEEEARKLEEEMRELEGGGGR